MSPPFSPIHNSNSSVMKNYLNNSTVGQSHVKVIRKGTMVDIKATRCNGVSECWNNEDEVYCSMDTFLTIFIGNFLYSLCTCNMNVKQPFTDPVQSQQKVECGVRSCICSPF